MTINITKAKLIRWIVIAVILVCGSAQAVDVPQAAVYAVRCREFMADFSGYDDYSLLEVYEWRIGMFAVAMLDPAGIKETLVYDCRNGKREVVYRDLYIPRKEKREEMRRESILVSDAVKIAKTSNKVHAKANGEYLSR
jgi:hypothetical protein